MPPPFIVAEETPDDEGEAAEASTLNFRNWIVFCGDEVSSVATLAPPATVTSLMVFGLWLTTSTSEAASMKSSAKACESRKLAKSL